MNLRFKILSIAVVVISAAALVGSAGSATSASIAAQAAPAAPAAPATPKASPAPHVETFSRVIAGSGGSYLGVDVQEITAERVSALKLKEERGVEIVMVDQDAPAGKAGLKEHDVILDFNGNRVEGQEQLVRMLHETPAGRQVMLGIIRDGQPMQVSVTLGDRRKLQTFSYSYPRVAVPRIPAMPVMPDIDIPAIEVNVRSYSRLSGMMVDNLTPQLGEFFGVKSGEGVLVRSVEKGSPAEAAGLKAGDVIVKVDSEKIGDRNDFNRAIRNRKAAKLALGIVREKREQTLTLTLPERRSESQARSKDQSKLWLDFDPPDFNLDMDFDSPDLDQLRELPKVQRELDRMRPEIQREIERARREAARTVAEQRSAQRELRAELERASEQSRREIEKVQRQLRALQIARI